uniref:RING-type E3 ubiquitin transferase n=1 Tax=Angiostrongylus cantonensis TaxID=6313 RepID=A0A158P845_ANGCA
MQTYVAELGEIVRAHTRDEEEIDTLQDRISWVVKELLGQRTWIKLYPYVRPFAKASYYSCTTIAGVQTIGEEYVNIFQMDSTHHAVPSLGKRFLFVLFHVIAPVLSQLALQRAQRLLAHPSTSSFLGISIRRNQKARKTFQELLEWTRSTGIPQLHRLHLAFFYIFGTYYSISRRVAGIRFMSLSPQTDLKALKVYKFLGYLTLAHTALSLMLLIISSTAKRTCQAVVVTEAKEDSTAEGRSEGQIDDSRSPSTTSCGHLFCWNCIQEHAVSEEDEIRCPNCRALFEPSQVVPLLNL